MKSLAMFLVVLLSVPCFGQEGLVEPYKRYGSNPYSRYLTNPPKIYSGGRYLGELSENRYRPDSVSNPHGIYGSRHSPYSINNPHSPYGRYSTRPIYVYPRW